MTPHAILVAARALIRDIAHWARGYWAYDANGTQVDPDDPDAVCWCAAGAINRVAPYCPARTEASKLMETLANRPGGLFDFNDTHTHAEVLALFDAAIAATAPHHEAPIQG